MKNKTILLALMGLYLFTTVGIFLTLRADSKEPSVVVLQEAKEEAMSKELVTLSQEETILLFHALLQECSICDTEEQKEVVKVFLSRKDDPRFPNTVSGVLSQKGAVHGVRSFDQKAWLKAYKSVLKAVEEERDPDVVGYYHPDKSTNLEWVDRMKSRVKIKHDHHHFHTI